MISVDSALQIVRDHRGVTSSEIVALEYASGRILKQDVVSLLDFPLFDNSAMDGFAVGSQEGPWELVGEVAAGDSTSLKLGPCQAVRIFTGAPVPSRTYGVIAQEDATLLEGVLMGVVRNGGHVRYQAEESSAGRMIASKGMRLTPPHVAALASCGIDKIEVLANPKVAIISSGDEVVRPGQPLRHGQIYNSNAAALASILSLWGIHSSVSHTRDCASELNETISEAVKDNDLLITTGGVSVGAYDLVCPAMQKAGFQIKFHGVSVKPGKPIAFGVRNDGKVWFGLPGNPLSTWVGALVFVSAWLGYELPRQSRTLASSYEKGGSREEFLPAILRPTGEVAIQRVVGSHANFALLESDGFARVDSCACAMDKGELIEFLPFPWSRNT